MKKLIICLLLIVFFAGCGSVDGSLDTSMITASNDIVVLDSDVVVWVDSAGAKATYCGSSSLPSIPAADVVNVTIASKAYSNTGSTGLPIRIDSATITYSPANISTPTMPTEFQVINTTIANGSSVTIPVRVASQEQKQSLYPSLACNGTIYNYYTKIVINVTEIGSDKKTTVETGLQLRFSDFIDK